MSASNIQCQIGHMAGNKPISDTMPKRGKVTEMCKEWLVHEDGALAYQLQQEEVEKHYSGNKSRNAIVREDFPMAKDAQQRAQDEALAEYYRQTKLLEEEDERIAREIAERLEREEAEKLRRLEIEDQRMARIMQERDKRAKLLARQGDINAVGLPLPETALDGAYGGAPHRPRVYENLPPPLPTHYRVRRTMVDVEQQFRRMQLEEDAAEPIWPPPPDHDQITKADQEKSDEELAKRLQLEEQSAELDMVDRDRMLAIEVQDLELAKMLQEKEKARLRRAKEKARAKALAKKQMEENALQNPPREGESEDPLALQLPPEQMVNIATAIDPTYVPPKAGALSTPPRSASSTLSSSASHGGALRHSPCYFPPDNILLDDTVDDSPPYMPVQGQRRTSSIEKKKKKSKDGDCKQQ